MVQYTGWLYEADATDHKGKQFDSSLTRHEPFKFPLGTGSVIKGWDQGVVGMKVGESRRLIIPPSWPTAMPARAASFRRARPWSSTLSSSESNRPKENR